MPSNGPPQNVPVARQRTAAWLRAATTSSTSMCQSGMAVKVWLKKERTSSGARRSRFSGARRSMPPSAQQSAIASTSRAATASKYVRATLPGPGTFGFCSPARSADEALTSVASASVPVLSAASDMAAPSSAGRGPRPRAAGAYPGFLAVVSQADLISSATEPRPSISSATRSSPPSGTAVTSEPAMITSPALSVVADRLQIAAHEPHDLRRVERRLRDVDRRLLAVSARHAGRAARQVGDPGDRRAEHGGAMEDVALEDRPEVLERQVDVDHLQRRAEPGYLAVLAHVDRRPRARSRAASRRPASAERRRAAPSRTSGIRSPARRCPAPAAPAGR